MSILFVTQIGSFTLGLTGLFWFTKKKKNYLKRSEALLLVNSFLFILLGTPDFQLPIARSFKIVFLVGLVVGFLLLSLYLVYYEKLEVGQKIDNEVDSLVMNFIRQKKNQLPFDNNYILVLIPAYNEGTNLKKVLKYAPKEVSGIPVILLVIDDGSSDDTHQIASKHSLVLSLPRNSGGGYALSVGFFVAKKLDAPCIVTMDADGQHKFSDLENLITPIFNGKAEIVLGTRFKADSIYSNKFRSTGIHLFNFVLKLILGRKVSDCSNSYRAFTLNALKQLDLKEQKHHTAEFVIRAAKKEITMLEIPVNVQNRLSGKSKKGNSILYALRFTRTILTSWWRQ